MLIYSLEHICSYMVHLQSPPEAIGCSSTFGTAGYSLRNSIDRHTGKGCEFTET